MRGDRVRELRRVAGKTQQQLAQEINVQQGHISQIEAGQTEPSVEVLAKLARALQTTTDYLIGMEESEGETEPAALALV